MQPPANGLDPVALYREALAFPRITRAALVGALAILCIQEASLIQGRDTPPALGGIASILIIGFYIVSLSAYFRILHRVRRDDPGAWRGGARLIGKLIGVPIGLNDPRRTPYDAVVLALTGLLAVALVVLSLLPKAGH